MSDKEGYYQMVCSAECLSWPDAVRWIGGLVGFKFPTGEIIEHVDNFQFIPLGLSGKYNAVATCSVYRPAEGE